MHDPLVHDLIGYLASALIVLSLLMSSVLRLRIIGLAGAIVFVTYGVLIGALPVVVTNGIVIMVQVYHLTKLLRARAASAYFEVIRWPNTDVYLPKFLDFWSEDIARTQPGFRGIADDHLAYVILRNAEPVGLVLARHDGSGTAQLDLDYVTPPHRDFTVGRDLFERSRVFGADGICRVVTRAETDTHRAYLERMGFEPESDRSSTWSREVC